MSRGGFLASATIELWRELGNIQWNLDFSNLQGKRKLVAVEKSGVREIEGGIKLHLIGQVLFGYQ